MESEASYSSESSEGGSEYDGSDASEDEGSGSEFDDDESGDDWDELERKAAKCTFSVLVSPKEYTDH